MYECVRLPDEEGKGGEKKVVTCIIRYIPICDNRIARRHRPRQVGGDGWAALKGVVETSDHVRDVTDGDKGRSLPQRRNWSGYFSPASSVGPGWRLGRK